METTKEYKEFNKKVRELKAKIKVAAEYQRFLKNQRKTVKLVGKREIDPSEATMKHGHNRLELRAMYMAYAIIRNKSNIELIDSKKFETNWDLYWFNKKVEHLVKEYYVEMEEEPTE